VPGTRDADAAESGSSIGHRRRANDRPGESTAVTGVVVAITYAERGSIEQQFGPAVRHEVDASVTRAFTAEFPDAVVLSRGDRIVVMVPNAVRRLEQRLGRARAAVAARHHLTSASSLRVTALVGYSVITDGDVRSAWSRAGEALAEALVRLDLVPVQWVSKAQRETASSRFRKDASDKWRLHRQITLSLALALGLPYVMYEVTGLLHIARTFTWIAYVVITVMLLITAISLYGESLAALDPELPPDTDAELPPASAIIAAYLPNEANTIVDTVNKFLDLDYAAGLQVVVAYNTPETLPVEDTLHRLAELDDRLVVLRILESNSKAQNVNAALRVVSGDIVGIFDADHHPAPGSFQRAWRWLANGFGVVQGHCVIRNGDSSWVSRTVAVEFEQMYGVSHPGRARLHGFGIFGGSNGYWRTELLREVRLRGTMLTEDIDSSLRVTLRGERIASDPGLISRELAPTRLSTLAGQRLRWAQGWSQVSLEYALSAVRSRRLNLRQRLGTLFLLGWREINPWMSLQMLPLIAYVLMHPNGRPFNWFVPLLVLSTLVTTLVGPFQVCITYLCAVPEIRRHRGWFLAYAVVNAVFYTEFKNALARVAHIKHARGEAIWRVTAREIGATTVAASEESERADDDMRVVL
jgi:cellulose synthase/poly-beta-1,6-N-acetylglucosamine synthase-like glycosyltransferase